MNTTVEPYDIVESYVNHCQPVEVEHFGKNKTHHLARQREPDANPGVG